MLIDMTPIIQGIFALLGAVLMTIIIPYSRSRTSSTQQAEIDAWVRIAVTAAEQIYTGSGRGAEKKAYVQQWLADHKINVDAAALDAMIESAVYALKSGVVQGG